MTVRAAAIREFPALVESLGGDGPRYLTRFGFSADLLAAPDALVDIEAGERMFEAAAAELSCPDFGLRLAMREDHEMLGVLAVAISNAPTVGEALAVTSRFLFVHSPVLSVTAGSDPEGQAGVSGLHYAQHVGEAAPQVIDFGIGMLHRVVLMLNGGSYGLRSVHLPHPRLAPLPAYTDFFGADVRFQKPAAVLRVPTSLAAAPVRGSDERLRTLALRYLESTFTDPGRPVGERVQAVLADHPGSLVRIDTVARLLLVHPRTLQRQLAAEGTSFDVIADQARRDAAHRLITESSHTLAEVAGLLGFTEQASLTRSVRRWFGTTPTALRRSAFH